MESCLNLDGTILLAAVVIVVIVGIFQMNLTIDKFKSVDRLISMVEPQSKRLAF